MREGKLLQSMQKAGWPCRATADCREQAPVRDGPTFERSPQGGLVKLRKPHCEQVSRLVLSLHHLP